MSEVLNEAELQEIEQWIPEGNPHSSDKPLRRVIASHRVLQAHRRKYGPICLVCGADELCHLKDDPNSPCTFDPAPRELWEKCQGLQQRIAWTKERPTKGGWYWLKSNYSHSKYSECEVVWVFEGAKDYAAMSTNGWTVAVSKIAGEWAGPIVEPQEARG